MSENRSLLEIIKEQLTIDQMQLWVFPAVGMELQELLNKTDSNIDQIAKLILKDQALAGHILRLANSAFFAGLKKVATIKEAIIRLGTNQIHSCVMLVIQRNLYRSKNETTNGYLQSLWKHALGCALGAKWLLEKTGYRELAHEGFLAALFHDIGKLFLLNVIERLHLSGKIDIAISKSLILDVLESMHTEYGCNLLRQWNLPEAYCEIASNHHKEEFDANDVLLLIVRIVNQACRKAAVGMNHDPSIVLASMPEADALGVKEVVLAELEIMIEDAKELNF